MTSTDIHIQDLTVRYGAKTVLDHLTVVITAGAHWIIGGVSGSGKSTFGQAIAGKIPFDGKVLVGGRPLSESGIQIYYVPNWYQFTNLEGDRNFYYQQRYNHHQGQDTLTVQAELEHYAQKNGLNYADAAPWIDKLGFTNLLYSQLIELSSGEHKKLQLVQALWKDVDLLIIDEPYTGLDSKSRSALNSCFQELAERGTQLMLITNDSQIPSFIDRFAEIKNGKWCEVAQATDFPKGQQRTKKAVPEFLKAAPTTSSSTIIEMHNVRVTYGDKTVLDGISWTVKAGERWLLQGSNGSGKSTLLSLVNGDHPQAYGHDIRLFGNRRGSGESIWDIKKRIGLISPEMHWYFDKNATVWHTLASGFYDSIGWFMEVKFHEKKQIEELMDFFDLTDCKNELLHTLPLGKQRLTMLARTIIKNPPLLVLDEPCQGLDQEQTTYFNEVVDKICQYNKTLIYVGHYESQLPSSLTHRIVLEKGQVNSNTALTSNSI